MYPCRCFSFSHPYSLIKHTGIGPGQQGHLPLCITSNATFWETAQTLQQIQIKRKLIFVANKRRRTENLTLMVSSNQSLFPYSLADIQDSSSHISYFHTKSKTLLEKSKTKRVSNLSLKYVSTFLSLQVFDLPK